jgi:hypothetical protein
MQDVHDQGATLEQRLDYSNTAFGVPWSRSISQSVAKLFFCKYYYSTWTGRADRKCEHHYVGKASNATTAALMAEYVNASVVKECRKLFRSEISAQARAFATGAADKIRSRVAEMQKVENVEGISTSTALVVVNLYKSELEANESFLSGVGVKLKTSASRTKASVNLAAYAAGKEFGSTVGLNNQVTGAKPLGIN